MKTETVNRVALGVTVDGVDFTLTPKDADGYLWEMTARVTSPIVDRTHSWEVDKVATDDSEVRDLLWSEVTEYLYADALFVETEVEVEVETETYDD